MSSFLKDTIELNKELTVTTDSVEAKPLKALFLPYFIHPDTMKLMVVIKRMPLPGAVLRADLGMGFTALETLLPEDGTNQTVEEAFTELGLPCTIQNPIPTGNVMLNPMNSTEAYELVVAQIDPPETLDDPSGVIKQVKGEYEVGLMEFDDLLAAIHQNLVLDMKTRLIVSELYILVADEQAQQMAGQGQDMSNGTIGGGNNGLVGGGMNRPGEADGVEDAIVTGDIPDEILEQNAQTDFGAIYSTKK